MQKIEFDKLLQNKTPDQILTKYMIDEISLTDTQLSKILKLRKGTPQEGHGGCNMTGGKSLTEKKGEE